MKRFMLVLAVLFVCLPFVSNFAFAAPPIYIVPSPKIVDSVIVSLKEVPDYDYAWSHILARGTGIYQEPPYSPVKFEWVMYTNSDAYVQVSLNWLICPRYVSVIKSRKDPLDRPWDIWIGATTTWIGIDNCWIGDFAESATDSQGRYVIHRRSLVDTYVGKLSSLPFFSDLKVVNFFN